MALNLVTGGLGTGKSYYAVRKGVEAMSKGRMLVTNFALEGDFAEQIAFRAPFRTLTRPSGRRCLKAQQLALRHIYVKDLAELQRVRVREEPPYGEWVTKHDGEVVWRVKEGMVIVILDEAHHWMNAREWSAENRKEILDFFALSRKNGMEVYVLTQHGDNVDAQVRRLCEDHIKLNNLKRSARFLGFRVIPFNLFIAITFSMHYPKEVARRDWYILNWQRNLYDTMETVSFSEHFEPEGGALWLPRRPDDEQDAAPDSSGSTAAGRADAMPAAAPDPRPDGPAEGVLAPDFDQLGQELPGEAAERVGSL